MMFRKPCTFVPAALLVSAIAVAAAAATAREGSELGGRWVLNHERTQEVQPADPKQRDLLGALPRTTVSVGGIPLPGSGGGQLPSAPGSARDPRVLQTATLGIEPAADELTLTYAGNQKETLERGDDQGLISRWSGRKLTTRYETTSRKVSQTYEVQRDGSLLVTVKLNPNQGPTLVHKRVFDRADPAAPR